MFNASRKGELENKTKKKIKTKTNNEEVWRRQLNQQRGWKIMSSYISVQDNPRWKEIGHSTTI